MRVVIRPQPGPQERALASTAKVVLLGGAKGGGKSYALRLAPVRYLKRPGYHAVIFRRSLPQVKNSGGQWDKSYDVYPHLQGRPHRSELKWVFPHNASIRFWHLLEENDWLDWQGTETAFFGFDQLEEFTQVQFLKILGCMRTMSGAPTQVMATMNPDAQSWVRSLVDPWIAQDGYVDPDMNGKTCFFTVVENQITWVDESWRDANNQPAISIVYLSADIWDNPALLESDPAYLSNLMTQSLVDRERFLGQKGRGGNWNIKAVAGKVFRPDWFSIADHRPLTQPLKQVRFWDLAASAKQNQGHDPDWTVGVKLALYGDRLLVLDVVRLRGTPTDVERAIANTASQDGVNCPQRWFRDPAQAGVYQDSKLRQLLRGYDAIGLIAAYDKYTLAQPFSRAVEFGEVTLVRAPWNADYLNELSQFPDGGHDDQVDASSGAYAVLTGSDVLRRPTQTGTARI